MLRESLMVASLDWIDVWAVYSVSKHQALVEPRLEPCLVKCGAAADFAFEALGYEQHLHISDELKPAT